MWAIVSTLDMPFFYTKGNHDVNHLQIAGDTLYVGIGAVGRKGDPDEENLYSMTIARSARRTESRCDAPG